MILTTKKSVNYRNDYFLNPIFKTVVNTILLLTTCFVYSQDCNLVIQGKVLGLHDNQPLEAAVVQIKGTNQNTISSANGEFTLNQLCDRDITLVISHLNCDVKEQKVDVDASTKITIYMDHHIELIPWASGERQMFPKHTIRTRLDMEFSSKISLSGLLRTYGIACQ